MGMYTEFVAAFRLKPDTPEDVIRILKWMEIGDRFSELPVDLPDHSFFKTERWFFVMTGHSFYFPGEQHASVEQDNRGVRVTFRSSIKNYNEEIEKFADWIAPYVDMSYENLDGVTLTFAGYKRYEEDVAPTLLYFVNNRPFWVSTEMAFEKAFKAWML